MLRGYYTAASGIVTQEKKLNTYANNISNSNTAGYKKDNMIAGVFGEHLAVRMNAYQNTRHHAIGPGVYMQRIDEKYTDYTQGTFDFTQRPMDIAIQGEGFFVISRGDEEYLTRDGQFSLDEEGYLILPGFGRVMGEGGEIEIETSRFHVDAMGNVYRIPEESEPDEEPELLDRLLIVAPENWDTLDKARDSLFTVGEDGYAPVEWENTEILQGAVERSNINMAEEMTRVIASQRALQSNSQIVRMYDDLADKITTQISRV
ncbi:MAG: flagellar hook-basal body protein [Oscillospiraceae bacterium]|nr:flagellar hook-basal body protein [Oscillospiraceae bacterium]